LVTVFVVDGVLMVIFENGEVLVTKTALEQGSFRISVSVVVGV
jgi:hypothetical protein